MSCIMAQPYDFYLVLDFESTCQSGPLTIEPQEVIELPCLLVSGRDFTIIDQFQEYVRPVAHPCLTPFCTELTGITQDMVKDRDVFSDVLARLVTWYTGHGLDPQRAAFVTCGQWDLVTMLPAQCRYSGIPVPLMLDVGATKEFVNIKLSFQEHTKKYAKGIADMQSHLGLTFQGRLHSGIDDCRNIRLVMEALARQGAVLTNNGMRK